MRAGAGAAGRLWYGEDAPAATVATPFDLASVTKPLTALALARLERSRWLTLRPGWVVYNGGKDDQRPN